MPDTLRPAIVFSERFLEPGERRDQLADTFSADRTRLIWQALESAGLTERRIEPALAPREVIEYVHTPLYVEAVREYSEGSRVRADDYHLLGPTVPVYSNTYELAALGVGAVCRAIDAVEQGEASRAMVLARPGCHHAYPERGEGFCVFNHTAVGARWWQRRWNRSPVLIVDVDVHHGNGTQAAFFGDPSVIFLSVHSFGSIYPRTGDATEQGGGPGRGATINIPLEPRSTDRQVLDGLRRGLRRVHGDPAAMLLVMGFDTHRDDPVGDFRCSDQLFPAITEQLLAFAGERCEGRIVSVLAGGYNTETIGELAVLHARSFLA